VSVCCVPCQRPLKASSLDHNCRNGPQIRTFLIFFSFVRRTLSRPLVEPLSSLRGSRSRRSHPVFFLLMLLLLTELARTLLPAAPLKPSAFKPLLPPLSPTPSFGAFYFVLFLLFVVVATVFPMASLGFFELPSSPPLVDAVLVWCILPPHHQKSLESLCRGGVRLKSSPRSDPISTL